MNVIQVLERERQEDYKQDIQKLVLQQLPCYTLRLFGCIHRFLCPDVFNKRDTKGYDRKYKMRIKREPEKSRSTNGWTSNSLITCQDCKIVIIDDQTCRCHQIPFIGAHRIQEPVILCEPHIITSHK